MSDSVWHFFMYVGIIDIPVVYTEIHVGNGNVSLSVSEASSLRETLPYIRRKIFGGIENSILSLPPKRKSEASGA